MIKNNFKKNSISTLLFFNLLHSNSVQNFNIYSPVKCIFFLLFWELKSSKVSFIKIWSSRIVIFLLQLNTYEAWIARSTERPFLSTKYWTICDSFPSRRVVLLKVRAMAWSYGTKRYCICVMAFITLAMLLRASSPTLRIVPFKFSIFFTVLWFAKRTTLDATLQYCQAHT